MKQLVFGNGLMEPSLNGDKEITLRKYRQEAHDFKEGEVIIGEFKDGLDVLLQIKKDTEVKSFNDLTDEEAQEDGFKDANDAFEGLKTYYPNLQKIDLLAIIRYKIPCINGQQIVRFNAHA